MTEILVEIVNLSTLDPKPAGRNFVKNQLYFTDSLSFMREILAEIETPKTTRKVNARSSQTRKAEAAKRQACITESKRKVENETKGFNLGTLNNPPFLRVHPRTFATKRLVAETASTVAERTLLLDETLGLTLNVMTGLDQDVLDLLSASAGPSDKILVKRLTPEVLTLPPTNKKLKKTLGKPFRAESSRVTKVKNMTLHELIEAETLGRWAAAELHLRRRSPDQKKIVCQETNFADWPSPSPETDYFDGFEVIAGTAVTPIIHQQVGISSRGDTGGVIPTIH
jgi:hypothetical protein